MLRKMSEADPSAAGPAWRALSEAQTAVAATRTGGMPLTVLTAPDAPGGPPGVCAVKAARIMLDGGMLPVAPDQLDPLANKEHMRALGTMHGVLLHECGHAVHTPEDRDELRDTEGRVFECVTLLEELRMESQVIRSRPEDAKWLRVASKELLLREDELEGEGAAFGAAVLVEGRVAAGTLKQEDVASVSKIVAGEIEKDTHEAILDICSRACNVADTDLASLISLGEELAELMPEQTGEQGGSGAELSEQIKEAIEEALGGEGLSEEAREELAELLEDKKAREDIAEAIEKQAKSMAGAADGAAPDSDEREATAEERKARNALHARLRKVRWRERATTHRSSLLPPGRLKAREALRRSAEKDVGKMTSARPWRAKKRRMVELPKLTCGILLDTSGSMWGTEKEMAGALWAISHAVHDNGGKVAATLFGNTSETIFPSGEPPRHVRQFSPAGGTEHVAEGIELLGKELGWEKEEGPRLLVIVSDGYWMEGSSADWAIEEAQRKGIVVIQVGIGRKPHFHGEDETAVIQSASDLALAVADPAVRELRSW